MPQPNSDSPRAQLAAMYQRLNGLRNWTGSVAKIKTEHRELWKRIGDAETALDAAADDDNHAAIRMAVVDLESLWCEVHRVLPGMVLRRS